MSIVERKPIYNSVENEILEQELKWGENKDRSKQSDSLWLVVLVEEVGEVAKEVCDDWNGVGDFEKLVKELVQVAAVSISWLESLEMR